MVKRLWVEVVAWSGWPLFVILACLMFAVPAAEETFLPIRSNQAITQVERQADRLCWTWASIKRRARVSDNLDAFIETDTDRYVTTVFNPATGDPWARSQALPPSPAVQQQRFCTLLPPSVRPGQTVKVTQVAFYPSLLPGLHTMVHVPDVVSKGSSATP